ncbi:hypothetical protein Hsar01_03783 [Haloferula sargassicola]|uniref:RHS repeat-associated core domain-containing protein n=2 Tax=Haloferula sargassicola TaxID=490096 RepID=A0ABP9UT55_9BACT
MTALRTFQDLVHGTDPGTQTSGFEVTIWHYDSYRGWLIDKEYPDGPDFGSDRDPGPSYTYTAGGRLKTRTWARGDHTRYDYDDGLLVGVRHFNGSGSDHGDNTGNDANTPDSVFEYNSFGQLSEARTVRVLYGTERLYTKSVYVYHPTSRGVDSETITIDPDGSGGINEVTRVLDRSQDSYRRNTGYNFGTSQSQEALVSYTYGNDGRLDTATAAHAGATRTFGYHYENLSDHLIDKISVMSSGSTVLFDADRTWEADRDLLSKIDNTTGSSVSAFDYGLNAIGQRSGVERSGSAFGTATDYDWFYDRKGQVAAQDQDGGTAQDFGYLYDDIGNRKRSSRNGTDPATATGSDLAVLRSAGAGSAEGANALNQPVRLELYGASPVNNTYDKDGNQQAGRFPNGNTGSRSWDGENQIFQETNGGQTWKYLYDHAGRRVGKWKGSGGLATGTAYFYDAWNVVAELDLAGNAYTLSRTYTWGTDLSGRFQGAGGVGGLLAVEIETGADAGVYYPAYDGNGNISEYLNGSGTVVAHYEYDPFGGEAVSPTGSKAALFSHRFSTKPLDPETGLYYYGYRYYHPYLGRWISRDPIGERGGLNLYGFVGNDGVNRWDYLGLDWAEYTGEYVTIYEGNPPNRGKVIKKCPAASGLPGHQRPSEQKNKDEGPAPEGDYNVDLRPDGNRTAKASKETGQLKMAEGGGVEKIPDSTTTTDGITYNYPGWGKNRALLEPEKGTNTHGRSSIYVHDSQKGFSHGCIECKDLMDHIRKIQEQKKQKDFPVKVNYTDATTAGATKPASP